MRNPLKKRAQPKRPPAFDLNQHRPPTLQHAEQPMGQTQIPDVELNEAQVEDLRSGKVVLIRLRYPADLLTLRAARGGGSQT